MSYPSNTKPSVITGQKVYFFIEERFSDITAGLSPEIRANPVFDVSNKPELRDTLIYSLVDLGISQDKQLACFGRSIYQEDMAFVNSHVNTINALIDGAPLAKYPETAKGLYKALKAPFNTVLRGDGKVIGFRRSMGALKDFKVISEIPKDPMQYTAIADIFLRECYGMAFYGSHHTWKSPRPDINHPAFQAYEAAVITNTLERLRKKHPLFSHAVSMNIKALLPGAAPAL